jgi:hypothetical protein
LAVAAAALPVVGSLSSYGRITINFTTLHLAIFDKKAHAKSPRRKEKKQINLKNLAFFAPWREKFPRGRVTKQLIPLGI